MDIKIRYRIKPPPTLHTLFHKAEFEFEYWRARIGTVVKLAVRTVGVNSRQLGEGYGNVEWIEVVRDNPGSNEDCCTFTYLIPKLWLIPFHKKNKDR